MKHFTTFSSIKIMYDETKSDFLDEKERAKIANILF